MRFSKYDFGSVFGSVFGFLKIAVIGSVFSLLPSDVQCKYNVNYEINTVLLY